MAALGIERYAHRHAAFLGAVQEAFDLGAHVEFIHTAVADEELQDIEDLTNKEVLKNTKVQVIEDVPIDVAAKIVDDNEWKKVLEGVYTGFSIGGRYTRKWPDILGGKMVNRYTAAPSEVSIVDQPCVSAAKFFTVHKADGTDVQVAFKIHRPHKVKQDGKWKVVDSDGHVYGTHDAESDADKQLAALYANKAFEMPAGATP